jgi:hypothetical protein
LIASDAAVLTIRHQLPWFGFLVALVAEAPKAKVLRERVASSQAAAAEIRERVGVVFLPVRRRCARQER